MILTLLFSILLANLLGPEGKGIFTLFLTTIIFLKLFSKMGMEQATVYYSGLNPGNRKQISGTVIMYGLIVPLFIASLFSFYLFFFNQLFLRNLNILILFLFIPVVLSKTVNLFGRFIFLSADYITYYNFFNITIILFPLLSLLPLLIFNIRSIELSFYLYSSANIFNFILLLFFLYKKELIKFSFHIKIFKQLIKFGYKTNIANILKYSLIYTNIYFIAYYLAPEQVGYYSISIGLISRFNQISEPIGAILFQRVSNSRRNIYQFIVKVYKFSFLLLITLGFGAMVLVKPVIHLLFPAFKKAVVPAYILIPGMIMFGLYIILTEALLGRGKTNFYLAVPAVLAVVNIILNLVFIPAFHINGAALSSTISYTLANVAVIWYFIIISKLKLSRLLVISKEEFKEFFILIKKIIKLKKISLLEV